MINGIGKEIGTEVLIEHQTKNATTSKAFEKTLKEAVSSQDESELKRACEEVETYMISKIFKQMKASTKFGEDLIEKGDYEVMFEDEMIQSMAKEMTQAGGIGLTDMMMNQMKNIK